MTKDYSEEEMLMLSGIQHFFYCKRQWALIHIEQLWEENSRTIEGQFVHKKVDDPYILESRGDILVERSVPLGSKRLGLYGVADVVEFKKNENEGVVLKNKKGKWLPIPIEYKRGEPKPDERDEVQLCAQAICIEEMKECKINKGYLYYHSIRRRISVDFNDILRKLTKDIAEEMHTMFNERKTPKARYKKQCKWCSMYELCQPKITGRNKKVNEYITRMSEII